MDGKKIADRTELDRAIAELRRKESRLSALDEEIAHIRFELEQMNSGKALRTGSAALISSSEAFRRGQRERLSRKLKERQNLTEDLQRFETQLAKLQEELKVDE